jgi:hypothetical protein
VFKRAFGRSLYSFDEGLLKISFESVVSGRIDLWLKKRQKGRMSGWSVNNAGREITAQI